MKWAWIIGLPACLMAAITIGATMGFDRPWPDRNEMELVASDHWCFRVYDARNERFRLIELVEAYKRRGQRAPPWALKRLVELDAAIAYYLRKARRPC